MIGLLLGLVLLSWIFGRNRGLIGGLAGGFVGAFVLAGMARTASHGELAAFYTPAELASSVLPVTLAGAVVGLIAPHAAVVVRVGSSLDKALGFEALNERGGSGARYPELQFVEHPCDLL